MKTSIKSGKKNLKKISNIVNFKSIFFLVLSLVPLYAGDYGDVYGAHPAANAMGNAVVSTVRDSSAVFYNIAGLGRMNYGDLYYG
ncbi:MAG: aromatic hydrocarbon degradation protein, partial [Leptospiraceae bacterium]|nr:aromatic hydrocarbon degradation protein [Leptospiraceae bacterium]